MIKQMMNLSIKVVGLAGVLGLVFLLLASSGCAPFQHRDVIPEAGDTLCAVNYQGTGTAFTSLMQRRASAAAWTRPAGDDDGGDAVCSNRAFYELNLNQQGNRSKTTDSLSAKIAVFEFDDEGSTVDPALYFETLRRIQDEYRQGGPILMMLFVHGWKHNASWDDSNLIDFEKLLLRLARDDADDRRVLGVYVGWRGSSIDLPLIEQATFYNRKERAHRVGNSGMTGLLADLRRIKNRVSTNRSHRMVLAGHSFGGAVLYSGVDELIKRDLLESRHERHCLDEAMANGFYSCGEISRTVADLVILINPAFEASQFTGLRERAQAHSFPQTQRPVLAVFTSEGDSATKYAFPIGRTLGGVLDKENPNRKDQFWESRKTLGHYQDFVSHLLKTQNDDETGLLMDAWDYDELLCSWLDFLKADTDTWTSSSGLELKRCPLTIEQSVAGDDWVEENCSEGNPAVSPDQTDPYIMGQSANPYLNVFVGSDIIPDHNKIWAQDGDPEAGQSRFQDFLLELVALQSASQKRFASACP